VKNKFFISKELSCISNDWFEAIESESNTLAVSMLTNRENFYKISLIVSVKKTSSLYYITPPAATDKRCQIGSQFNFEYEFDNFSAVPTEVVNYIIFSKVYNDILCPLTTFNAAFELVNEHERIERFVSNFKTSIYLNYLKIIKNIKLKLLSTSVLVGKTRGKISY
jgi:hypothetical protein